jgi:hypothetical protein
MDMMRQQMTPAVERLVRLMLLLPSEHHHPLWKGLQADCGDTAEVSAMRWFVGDAARMWPPAGPGNLARAVLMAFGAAGDGTLRLISDAVSGSSGQGPQAGAAWVSQAIATAAEVLAWERPLDEILQEAQDHWTLHKPPAGR